MNFTLHSIFRQIDLSLNPKIVSPDVGVNYPYKAMIDLLLNSTSDMISSQGVDALFHKDQPGQMDAAVYIGGNSGYTERARLTKDGQSASLEGCLYLDFGIEQNRAILNG